MGKTVVGYSFDMLAPELLEEPFKTCYILQIAPLNHKWNYFKINVNVGLKTGKHHNILEST